MGCAHVKGADGVESKATNMAKDDETDMSARSVPMSSWNVTSHGFDFASLEGINLPPNRRSHERHLMVLDRFLAGVDRLPHRFTQKVQEYREVEGFSEEDDDEVSVYMWCCIVSWCLLCHFLSVESCWKHMFRRRAKAKCRWLKAADVLQFCLQTTSA